MENLKNTNVLENLVRNKFEDAIRLLRKEIYLLTKHTYAHERVWEDEDEEAEREKHNKEKRAAWDEETEEIIRGCYGYDKICRVRINTI